MIKYQSLFKIKFISGLQYRAAAWAGIFTQFAWGFLEILMFKAFYEVNPTAFPMDFTSLVSYVWLQQALLALYMIWFWENDIFESIQTGNVAYELVRPISVYNMWFARSIATRISKTVLRALPILVVAFFLPKPFNLSLPSSFSHFMLFLITMVLALFVIIALNMIIYFLSFFTINSFGMRMVFQSLGDLLSGSVIPLPFFPPTIGAVASLLPFAAIQNVPFRIYSGDLTGDKLITSLSLQVFWVISLILCGKLLEKRVINHVVIQGG